MDVSVVIVSWNSELYIHGCLESIMSAAQQHTAEIIVVDNGSTDQTVQIVRRYFPEVQVIETHANLGFAHAVNVGSRRVRGRYLFLLNPDSKVSSDTIDKLVDFLDSHPDAGAVSPRILDEDGRSASFSVRQFPSLTNTILRQSGLRRLFPNSRLFGCETLGERDRSTLMVVACVSGAAIMLSQAVFESVGRLNEELPMYFEDLELCAQVGRIARIYYFPESSVVHFGRKSAGRSPSRLVLVAMENGEAPWMFLRRYGGPWHARAFKTIVFIGTSFRLVVRGALLLFAALFRRKQLEYEYLRAADSWALLQWCISPRQVFLSRIAAVFKTDANSQRECPLVTASCRKS